MHPTSMISVEPDFLTPNSRQLQIINQSANYIAVTFKEPLEQCPLRPEEMEFVIEPYYRKLV